MVLNDKYVKLSDLMEYPIRLDHYDKKHGNEHFVLGAESVLEYAEYLATSDVAEIKHGRWIPFKSEHAGDIQYCSSCDVGCTWQPDYCPNCGAKMDSEKPTWIPRDAWEFGCEYDCPYCGETIDVPHGSILPRKCWKCEKEIGVR